MKRFRSELSPKSSIYIVREIFNIEVHYLRISRVSVEVEDLIFIFNFNSSFLSPNAKLNIVGINYKDSEINAKKFLKELGNPYTNIITDPKGINSIELGAFGVPETFLIDNNSKLIIKKFIGPLDDSTFNQLTKLIK